MLKQSLNRQIFSPAIATTTGFLGIILFATIDIFWVGKPGTNAHHRRWHPLSALDTLFTDELTNTGAE